MSDNILYILPKDPAFVPVDSVVQQAIDLARVFAGGCDEASSSRSDSIRYFDPVECWEGIQCPVCRANLEEQWHHLVDRAHAESAFECLTVKSPCCGATVSLNEMLYPSAAASGFARFAIELWNPAEFTIAAEGVQILEAQLGCELRTVLAHV